MNIRLFYISTSLILCLLIILTLCFGSTSFSIEEIKSLFTCHQTDSTIHYIFFQLRIPAILTAFFAGSSLGVCGLCMQSIFKNSLADPSLLGVNSGAALGIVLWIIGLGGSFYIEESIEGLTLFLCSFLGALAVLICLVLGLHWLKKATSLLLIGLLLSYALSALISILSLYISSDGLQLFLYWSLGSFQNVSLSQLPFFVCPLIAFILLISLEIKALNALMLGEDYARNLGIAVHATQIKLILWVGFIVAVITSFCGPITFIGFTAPHLTRLILRRANHRVLIPATFLLGGTITLFCYGCSLWLIDGVVLPINVLTPLIGVPLLLHFIFRSAKMSNMLS